MIKNQVEVGMKVSCKTAISAYYSEYAGNPKQEFSPGMVGIIGAVDVPYVRRSSPKCPQTFCCVDFIGDNGKQWRASIDYANLIKAD